MQNIDYFKFIKRQPSKLVNEMTLENLKLNQNYISSISESEFELFKKIIKSDYLQMEYRKATYKNYIPPRQLELESEHGSCHYSYVSPIELCQQALNNKFLIEHLLKEKEGPLIATETFKSIMDGSVAQRLKGKLKVEIFVDDALISSSNRNQSQKHLFVYLTFPDIPFKERTHSNNIDMILMINRKKLDDLKLTDSMTVLFKQLRKDLRKLICNGIQVKTSTNVETTIYVTLSTVCGDSLGCYELLGFRMSFAPNAFICRYCSATGNTRNNNQLSIQDLSRQGLLIEEPTNEQMERLQTRRQFSLKNLPEITQFNLCPADLMHDLPEGVLPDVIEMILTNLVANKLVGASTIQNSIRNVEKEFERFKFYEGKPLVKWSPTSKRVIISGKAVEVSNYLNNY